MEQFVILIKDYEEFNKDLWLMELIKITESCYTHHVTELGT